MSTGTGTGTRAARQARIVEIVSREQVRSQTELLSLLEAEGIETTQATLSRDLDELGAVKLRGADGGIPVYVIPDDGSPVRGIEGGTGRLARLLGELLVSADATGRGALSRQRAGPGFPPRRRGHHRRRRHPARGGPRADDGRGARGPTHQPQDSKDR